MAKKDVHLHAISLFTGHSESVPVPLNDGKPRPARKMLNEAQVLEIIPVSRVTLYRMVKSGRFPKSIYVSPNRRVWFLDEVVAWQNAVDEFDPARGRGTGRRRVSA